MFDRIARVYDRMNSVMTAGMHHRWRERAGGPRRGWAPARARSTWPPAPATWRSSWRAAAPRSIGHGLLAGDARAGAREGAGASRFEEGNALALPLRGRRVRRRDGRLRRAQLLRPRPRPARDGARDRARAAGWWCSRSPRRSGRRCPGSSALWFDRVGAARSAAWPATPTPTPTCRASVRRFPGPRSSRRGMAAAGLDGRALDPHRRRHHRPPRGHGRSGVNTAQAQLGAVLAAGGPRAGAAARAHRGAAGRGGRRATARSSAGTPAARSRRAASGCGRCSCSCAADGDGDERLVAAAAAVELLHMATLVHDDVLDRAPLRRGRPTVFASGGRLAATATGDLLFSRAFAELAATGSEDAVRALRRASSALARGELMQRADAWSADVTPERYLERCRLKTAQPVRGLLPARARCSAAGPDAGRRAGPLRRAGRAGVPDARRRARRVRARRAHRQAARHRPARRHGDAAADPGRAARTRAAALDLRAR